MEVGAAAQNVSLEAECLGLGTIIVGAFYEMRVQSALELPEGVTPLCLMPVGKE
jgi:nitroreductase